MKRDDTTVFERALAVGTLLAAIAGAVLLTLLLVRGP